MAYSWLMNYQPSGLSSHRPQKLLLDLRVVRWLLR